MKVNSLSNISNGTLLRVDKHITLLDADYKRSQTVYPGELLIFLSSFHDEFWEGAYVLARDGIMSFMWLQNMQQGCNSRVSVA
jgi:hypothetical protein